MSVLGYNTIGASQRNSAGFAYSCTFTPTEDGTIDDIVVYVDILNGSRDVTVALFADNAGVPDTLLAYGTTQTGLTAAGWYTFSGLTEVIAGNLDITNGTPIHLAAWVNENGTNVKWRYDGGGTAYYLINLGGGAFDTWADVTSAGGPESDTMSIYVNYTAAGGGSKRLTLLGVG